MADREASLFRKFLVQQVSDDFTGKPYQLPLLVRTPALWEIYPVVCCGGRSMRTKSITKFAIIKVALIGAFVAALPLSPVQAAKAAKATKMTGACAQSGGRCVSDCDQLNWCAVYTCANGKSTPVPFWRCFEPSGLCLAPRC
jgi:hypothetical protein